MESQTPNPNAETRETVLPWYTRIYNYFSPPTPIKRATFQVESDWHLEQSPGGQEYATFDVNFPFKGDFLILAGDCGRVNPMARLPNSIEMIDHCALYEAFLSRVAENYKLVIMVGGNNEPKGNAKLGDSIDRLLDMGTRIENLEVLERDSLHLKKYGITVIGCTLWSCIRTDAHSKSGDAGDWTGETNAKHNARFVASLQYLKEEVAWVRAHRPTDRIIIVTHHTPTIRGSGQQKPNSTREYFSGPTKDLQFSGYQNDLLGGEGIPGLREGDHWVFGHTHYSSQFTQDDVRCTSNQRGGARNDNKLQDTNYKKGQVLITV